MDPVSWILASVLALSSGSNWWQYQKIDNLAKKVQETSTELQAEKTKMKKKDLSLVKAEVASRHRRKTYQDELSYVAFIINSQAVQLNKRNKDTRHSIHAKTTKGLTRTMGKPLVPPDSLTVWKLKYISDREAQLALAKLEKEALEEQVEKLRSQLRTLQTNHYSTLDELDNRSEELNEVTHDKASIANQFSQLVTYGMYAAIIWGLFTLYGYIKGFYNKKLKCRYERAIKEFGIRNDDGNETAAQILKDLKLEIPSVLQRHL